MTFTPRKAGIIISGGNPWEILFCFLHLEKQGYLRIPISVPQSGPANLFTEVESELARMSITPLLDVKATGIDALIIPGGRRLIETMSNLSEAGNAFRVDEEFKNLIKGIYRLNKPIAAFGSASVLVTKSLQGITHSGLVVTVGSDPKLQAAIMSTGSQAVVTRPSEVILDQTNKLVTTGGELGTKRPSEVYESCGNMISAISELIKNRDEKCET
jgi:enhancing lycopene biosynthesis protein 2